MSVSAFARRLPQVVEIKSSRKAPLVYTQPRSIAALEADLRRGLRMVLADDAVLHRMMEGLLWWRFNKVNPRWGFIISGPPYLAITPKRPAELLSWIDAAVKLTGNEESIKRRFAREWDKLV